MTLLANAVKIILLNQTFVRLGYINISLSSCPLPLLMEAPKVHCHFTFSVELTILEESVVNETLLTVIFKTRGCFWKEANDTKVGRCCTKYFWLMFVTLNEIHFEICHIIQWTEGKVLLFSEPKELTPPATIYWILTKCKKLRETNTGLISLAKGSLPSTRGVHLCNDDNS